MTSWFVMVVNKFHFPVAFFFFFFPVSVVIWMTLSQHSLAFITTVLRSVCIIVRQTLQRILLHLKFQRTSLGSWCNEDATGDRRGF